MISDYYTQTAVILRYNATSTGGYWSTTTGDVWDTVESISCAVNLLTGREAYYASKNDVLAEYKLYCDKTTNLTKDSRIRWDGDTYDVVEIPKNTLQKDHHYKVLMRKVTAKSV